MMINNYARPLVDNQSVEEFLLNVLGYEKNENLSNIVKKIVSAEIKMCHMSKKGTLFNEAFRDHRFRDEDERRKLRNSIIKELMQLSRLQNDNDIKLGEGGAKPRGREPEKEKSAYIIIGPPASGKSKISNTVADAKGGIILDSDYVKRKLPEFDQDNGASLVHEESSAIIFGNKKIDDDELTLYNICVSYGFNVVIPKIGHNQQSILDLSKKLKDDGYDVHLILVSLDRAKATNRALNRFLETERYVPLSLVFDGYANDPILTYYRIRGNEIYSSYGKVSTDVEKGHKPIIIEYTENNPVTIFGEEG